MEITGETGSRGQAAAASDPRHLPLPGTFNLRDLGGYPAGDGGTVRWRTLLRSDALHWLTDGGRAALRELGLRTVIDLRTQAETEIAPSALDSVGARTLHISVLDGDLRKLPVRLDSIYQFIVDERGAAIGRAVGQLCAPGALPALIHCAAGKDRTGIVVALVLACAGVPDDIIAADYALSGSYLNPGSTAAIGQVKASSGLQDQLADSLLGSPPELILQVLDRVRRRWGSAGDYLIGHGLLHGELVALRAGLIEYPARSYPPAGAGGAASPA
jgi:protein-tyrosine phosphatase